MKTLITFDLDGVLVDSSHRYRNLPNGSIDLDYWRENCVPDMIARDTLLPHADDYRAAVADPLVYTVICTAREACPITVDYIADNLGMPDKLIMRPRGNMRPDGELKRAQLAPLFNLRQFNRLRRYFLDDNPRNLRACNHLFDRVILVPSHITGTK